MASPKHPESLGAVVIPVVNKLQDIFARVGAALTTTISLPQVAVVGSQSSGKSSVLEALVGRDFLPRGPDICTRRPLVLQLVQLPLPSDVSRPPAEWGEFLHRPGERFYDFDLIRCEIEAETEREAGTNKGISDRQIRLKIFSPNVLNITLVDLPGITKVPVGDQPTDIETRIRTMVHSYIKHETCIILAVSPANSDLANSDALQMARMADPDGSRTIGVITKLDIMDKGTDACNHLLGKVIPLRLGYIGVVNRSKRDIDEKCSIAEALVNEEDFFHTHAAYHAILDRCGIPHLAKKLNQILSQHIKMVLPDLKSRLNMQLAAAVRELRSYGEIVETNEERRIVLLNIITKFCEAFSSMIEGKYHEMCTTELSGGARILYIFQSIFVKTLEEIDPCEDLTDDEIRTAIQNATGTRSALFVPEVPFEVLVRRRIARLLDPSLQCLRFVYDELIKISHACQNIELQRFPVLGKRLEEVLAKFLRDSKRPAERMIMNIIDMEMDYINTSHPNFIGGSKAVELALQQMRSQKLAAATAAKVKDPMDNEKVNVSEKGQKSRSFFSRPVANGVLTEQVARPPSSTDRQASIAGNPSTSGAGWGISSIFGGSESKAPKVNPAQSPFAGPVQTETIFPLIQLKEPPSVLRSSEEQTENEAVEIAVTRLLLKSYYDIVRKNIQDLVPKAIMHFLVNHSKRELLGTLIRILYREEQFNMLLSEREEIAIKRQRTQEMYHVLQQAVCTLDELPVDLDEASSSRSGIELATSIPRGYGVSLGENGSTNGDTSMPFTTSSSKSSRKNRSGHSEEQQSQPLPRPSSNGGLQYSVPPV